MFAQFGRSQFNCIFTTIRNAIGNRFDIIIRKHGAAPLGAVPSGGLFVTGTVTVPVTVSVTVTVIFVIVCFGLLSFVIACFDLPHLFFMPFLPASERFFLIVSHFSLQLSIWNVKTLNSTCNVK